jgi:hypothetical protein
LKRFSLCLSRACLGKMMIILSTKWRKRRFVFLPALGCREVIRQDQGRADDAPATKVHTVLVLCHPALECAVHNFPTVADDHGTRVRPTTRPAPRRICTKNALLFKRFLAFVLSLSWETDGVLVQKMAPKGCFRTYLHCSRRCLGAFPIHKVD